VLKGTPFRDAYLKVAETIKDGTYHPSGEVHHTHKGSIGNLCNDEIKKKMEQIVDRFDFIRAENALGELLK
jgi:argininosuccinate lyase